MDIQKQQKIINKYQHPLHPPLLYLQQKKRIIYFQFIVFSLGEYVMTLLDDYHFIGKIKKFFNKKLGRIHGYDTETKVLTGET